MALKVFDFTAIIQTLGRSYVNRIFSVHSISSPIHYPSNLGTEISFGSNFHHSLNQGIEIRPRSSSIN